MKEILRKFRKVKRGTTLEEAETDGAPMTVYARIDRWCRDDKHLGVSRHPYELAPGVSPLAGGYFENREWEIRRGSSILNHYNISNILNHESLSYHKPQTKCLSQICHN
jgi:hypothetical protein